MQASARPADRGCMAVILTEARCSAWLRVGVGMGVKVNVRVCVVCRSVCAHVCTRVYMCV